MPTFENKRVLIVVRTYPTPAAKGVEVSCTAGITEQGEWIRIFPIPYRLLDRDKQFAKYQWVDVRVIRARDSRPESHSVVNDDIRIASPVLSTEDSWKARREIVQPLVSHCLCCLKDARNERGEPTLGVFRPKTIARLVIEKASAQWTTAQLEILRQRDLFGKLPAKELEKIPHKFKYEFTCDHAGCEGHALSCTDWEIGQAWRSWRTKYGDDWEVPFRQRFEDEMINRNDTHFFVGTVREHPAEWIVVGLFYPPKRAQPLQRDLFA